MKKSFLLVPLLALLVACHPPMTREQELAIYRSRCFDYGFQYGTLEFAQCMQEQEAREAQLYMQRRKIQAIEEKNWTEQQRFRAEQDKVRLKNQDVRTNRKKVNLKKEELKLQKKQYKQEKRWMKNAQ